MESPRPPRAHSRVLRAQPWLAATAMLALITAGLPSLSGCGPGLQSLFGRGYGYGYGPEEFPKEGLVRHLRPQRMAENGLIMGPLPFNVSASSPWADEVPGASTLTVIGTSVVFNLGPGGQYDLGLNSQVSLFTLTSALSNSQTALTACVLANPNPAGNNAPPGLLLRVASQTGGLCNTLSQAAFELKYSGGVAPSASISTCFDSGSNAFWDTTLPASAPSPSPGNEGLLFCGKWDSNGPGIRAMTRGGTLAQQGPSAWPSIPTMTPSIPLDGKLELGAYTYSGGISEVLLYNRSLSEPEFDRIRGYFRRRYGGSF